jgi:uncharacterized BrkB/YihY/UPF0761 family membrane protein
VLFSLAGRLRRFVSNASYNVIYGALASAALPVWLYLVWIVILLGASWRRL